MKDAEQSGSRTLKVTWHPNAVSGAVERAAELTSTSDPDGVCQVPWMDLACLLDLARAALAEPGEVEQAVMEEALRWRKIVEQWERGHQNDVLPYTAKLEAEVERLKRELDGVAAGCTAATAGAPVSPVQTTVHADLRVMPIDARDRIERVLREYNAPVVVTIADRIMRALTDSAGSVSPKGDNTDD